MTYQTSEAEQLTSRAMRLHLTLIAATSLGLLVMAVAIAAVSIVPFYKDLRQKQQDNITFAMTTRTMTVEQYLTKAADIGLSITSRTKARKLLEAYNRGDVEFDKYHRDTAPLLIDAHDRTEEIVGITRVSIERELMYEVGIPVPEALWVIPVSGTPIVTGPHLLGGQQVLLVAAPIEDTKTGLRSGTDFSLFTIDALQAIVEDYTGLGETGETLLGRSVDGRLESFFPMRDGAVGPLDAGSAVGMGLQRARLGSPGMVLPSDNSERLVLGYNPIPGMDGWALLVKMDEDELHATVRDRLQSIVGFLVLIIVGSALSMVLMLQPLAGTMRRMTERLTELFGELQRERDLLEVRVDERTDELRHCNDDMRLVLDNVDQGLLTLDLEGVMNEERSKIIASWLGPASPGTRFADYLGRADPTAQQWFDLGWDSLQEGFLPLELCLDQLVRSITIGDRVIRLEYSPIEGDDGALSKVLVVMTDISATIERERMEQAQRETMKIFESITRDRSGFLGFYAEAKQLVRAICADREPDLATLKRTVHTLKGNASLFGLSSIAAVCHDIESQMEETQARPDKAKIRRLGARWEQLYSDLEWWLGEKHGIEIDDEDYQAILAGVSEGVSKERLTDLITAWKLEPTRRQLARVARQAEQAAQRLNKELAVDIDDRGLRLDADRWSTFWASFVHVVRNAVDHGLEAPAERIARGKPKQGGLRLSTFLDGDFVIEIADDGRGIDWEAVRVCAERAQQPCGNLHELTEVLFYDGLSTKDQASMFSGRGIGLGAVRRTCREMGGRTWVHSTPGAGTTLQFRFPVEEMYARQVDHGVLIAS